MAPSMRAQSLADLRLSRAPCMAREGMVLGVGALPVTVLCALLQLLVLFALHQLVLESRLNAVAATAEAAAAATAAPFPKAAEKDERRRDEEERRKCILALLLALSVMVSVRGLFAACSLFAAFSPSSTFWRALCSCAVSSVLTTTSAAATEIAETGDEVRSVLIHPALQSAAAGEAVASVSSSSSDEQWAFEVWPPGASCLRLRRGTSLLSTWLRAATSSCVHRWRVASTHVRPLHTSRMVFDVTPNLGASVLQCCSSGVPRVLDGRSS